MKYLKFEYQTEYGGKGTLTIAEVAYNTLPSVKKTVDKILHPKGKKVKVIVTNVTSIEVEDQDDH